jgi:hypothetical protein
MHTKTWLTNRTASLLPVILPDKEASATCKYNYWSSCESALCLESLPFVSFEKKYWYSSCGGVVGWRQSGCCY